MKRGDWPPMPWCACTWGARLATAWQWRVPPQVEATGTRLELYGSEVTQCGNGDDVVPRDLGAIDIQVRCLQEARQGVKGQVWVAVY